MGCFWGAERVFWQAPGVYTTAVGYAGGFTPNPTYEEVCCGRTGHNEVVLVVFRPAEISYDELLRLFWEGHDPTQGMRQGNDVGTQYRSAIYVTSDAQRARRREASRDAYAERLATAGYGEITTEIEPRRQFYYAEDYHQQYLAKNPNGYCGLGGTGVSCPVGLAGVWPSEPRPSGARGRPRGPASGPVRRATRPTRRARRPGTGSAASADGRQPHHHRHAVRQPQQRLDAQAAAARAATPRAARAERLGRALAQVHRPARAERPAVRPGGHPAGAAARPASARPSVRTTQSAVRLSEASPSTRRSAQRDGCSSSASPPSSSREPASRVASPS